jgi:hypothetical protein
MPLAPERRASSVSCEGTKLSDEDARALAGGRTLLASLHAGPELSLIHNPGIWQKIHCAIAHRGHNAW